jgi:hypothetical protein
MARLTVEVPDKDVWSAVFGSGFETWGWWRDVTYLDNADWDKPGRVQVVIDDPEYPEGSGKVIGPILSLHDVVAAINNCTRDGHIERGWDDWDACDGDAILQYAVFGDIIYG